MAILWNYPDISPWNPDAPQHDIQIVTSLRPVPCRICENVFGRLRLTACYCHECGMGICVGEHGIPDENRFICVRCSGRMRFTATR